MDSKQNVTKCWDEKVIAQVSNCSGGCRLVKEDSCACGNSFERAGLYVIASAVEGYLRASYCEPSEAAPSNHTE